MEGDVAYPEVFGTPVKEDGLSTEGKGELVARFQDPFSLIDSAGLCVFLAVRYLFNSDRMILPIRLAQLMSYTTGVEYTPEDILEAAERVYNLERIFLLKAGSTEDTLPPKMLNEPLPDGPAKGHVNRLSEMLPEFYEVRGWDENGVPTEEKLKELGIN